MLLQITQKSIYILVLFFFFSQKDQLKSSASFKRISSTELQAVEVLGWGFWLCMLLFYVNEWKEWILNEEWQGLLSW